MSITPSTPVPPTPPAPPRPAVPVPAAVSSFATRLDRVAARAGGRVAGGATTAPATRVTAASAEAATTLGAMLRAGMTSGATPPPFASSVVQLAAARPLAAASAAAGATGAVAAGATLVQGADVLADRLVAVPVDGRTSSRYGPRVHPIHGGVRDHHGLDVAAPTGTPVRSVTGGTVVRAGDAGGYGLLVEVDHGDGITSRYAHLSAADVRVGDVLAAGEVLGAVGSTGASTGPHLHLEVRVDGAPIDPERVLPGL